MWEPLPELLLVIFILHLESTFPVIGSTLIIFRQNPTDLKPVKGLSVMLVAQSGRYRDPSYCVPGPLSVISNEPILEMHKLRFQGHANSR